MAHLVPPSELAGATIIVWRLTLRTRRLVQQGTLYEVVYPGREYDHDFPHYDTLGALCGERLTRRSWSLVATLNNMFPYIVQS